MRPGRSSDSPKEFALIPSPLTLLTVFDSGHHAAAKGGVTAPTAVTIIDDDAVDLLAALSAARLVAEQIVLDASGRGRPSTPS